MIVIIIIIIYLNFFSWAIASPISLTAGGKRKAQVLL